MEKMTCYGYHEHSWACGVLYTSIYGRPLAGGHPDSRIIDRNPPQPFLRRRRLCLAFVLSVGAYLGVVVGTPSTTTHSQRRKIHGSVQEEPSRPEQKQQQQESLTGNKFDYRRVSCRRTGMEFRFALLCFTNTKNRFTSIDAFLSFSFTSKKNNFPVLFFSFFGDQCVCEARANNQLLQFSLRTTRPILRCHGHNLVGPAIDVHDGG